MSPPVARPLDTRLRLIRARALASSRSDVLADFEIELLREVNARVASDPGAVVTAAEWRVIDDAVSAMASAPRQDLTAAGLAA